MAEKWYAQTAEEVLDNLDVSREGLTTQEAQERLGQYGPNAIEMKSTPPWLRFVRQFKNMVSYILLVATVISVAAGLHVDAAVIIGVVVINAIFGYFQEGSAEKAVAALREGMAKHAMTYRDGQPGRINANDLVPGDVIKLVTGDAIPADCRVVVTNNGHVDESALTGESFPVRKGTDAIEGEVVVYGDQTNMLFSGTFVTQGKITAVVTDTGMQTVYGSIAESLKESIEPTPLEKNVNVFLFRWVWLTFALAFVSFVASHLMGRDLVSNSIGTISLIVAAIPATLPALLTAVYTLTTQAMKASNALVTRLPMSVVLGDVNVICSDKTGTLTRNEMTVVRAYSGGRIMDVTTGDTELEGEFLYEDESVDVDSFPALIQLLKIGAYCNDSVIGEEGAEGSPTEVAVLAAAMKAGVANGDVIREEEIEFNSKHKYMAVLVCVDGRKFVFVKGAPEVVLEMCTHELEFSGDTKKIDKSASLRIADAFAQDALRTIACAYKEVPADHVDLKHDDLGELVLAGYKGIIDPPKESAIEAIADAKVAGIRTAVITGDHPETALAIARKMGIPAERAVTGAEWSHMEEDERSRVVEEVSVFARVQPNHKMELARDLMSNGHIVAMMGDGVNDAPALKEANIGVAMGIQGTDLARSVAGLILLDDSFSTIIKAIDYGRDAFVKVSKKVLIYTIPTNLAQMLLVIGAVLMMPFLPVFTADYVLVPIMILWINLLDAVAFTIPLIYEPKENGLLLMPPRDSRANIFNRFFRQRMVLMGVVIALPAFFIYWYYGSAAVVDGVVVDPVLLRQAQTAAFWSVLLSHIGYVVSARSADKSVFSFEPWIIPFSNKVLLWGIGISIAVRLLPTFVPETAIIFKTEEFPLEWWPMILVSFFPSLIAIEMDKLIRRKWAKRAEMAASVA